MQGKDHAYQGMLCATIGYDCCCSLLGRDTLGKGLWAHARIFHDQAADADTGEEV